MSDSQITHRLSQVTAALEVLNEVGTALPGLMEQDPRFGLPVHRNLQQALRRFEVGYPELWQMRNFLAAADRIENEGAA